MSVAVIPIHIRIHTYHRQSKNNSYKCITIRDLAHHRKLLKHYIFIHIHVTFMINVTLYANYLVAIKVSSTNFLLKDHNYSRL